MKKSVSEVLATIAPDALVEVFASYGVHLEEQAAPRPFRGGSIIPKDAAGGAIAAGVIGFTGQTIRGTLLLATTLEIIGAARPAEIRTRPLSKSSASDWIIARDWVGELTNQVLGRIKSRLRSYAIAFDVSPPTALSGAALTFAAPKGPAPQHQVFVFRGQHVWFCLDAFFDSKREVEPRGEESEPGGGRVILLD
jgi:CheY-specific phosphatase CheX